MAALWSRADRYIFALWFLLSTFFSSPNVSRRRLDVCHTCTHGVAFSANLGCMSETCCVQLAENTGCKKSPNICHLGTIAQLCQAIFSQLRHLLTIGKILVKQQYFLQTSSQCGEHRPTNNWDGLSQQILTGFTSWLHYCSDVAHWRPTKLCTIFGHLVGWYTMYTFFWAIFGWF